MILQCPNCGSWMWDVEDIALAEYYFISCLRFHIVMVVDPDLRYLRMAGRKKWESEEDDRVFDKH
jgi:hypothetical protein